MRWRTPLGLPVVQPYRSRSKALVRTVLQTFSLQTEDESRPVTKMKQRSAFPPNFIHSVDSSHMMLTAIGCHEAGLTFAGVHDSFWTHAATCAARRQSCTLSCGHRASGACDLTWFCAMEMSTTSD